MADAATTSSASKPGSVDPYEFDYEAAKIKYLAQIKKYYGTHKLNKQRSMTRLAMYRKVRFLLNIKKKIDELDTIKMDKWKRLAIENFDVVPNGNTYKMVLKCDPTKEVLCCEDSFNAISYAHIITKHGHVRTIANFLKQHTNYSISKQSIRLFLDSCNICAAGNRPKALNVKTIMKPAIVGNKIWQVETVALPFRADNHFQYILFTEDKNTRFIQVRPLVTIHIDEVALELFKIFIDFGFPSKIESGDKCGYYKSVRKSINKIYPECMFSVWKPTTQAESRVKSVISDLQDWISETGSQNWAIGCRMVQFKWNNTFDEKLKSTPLMAVLAGNTWGGTSKKVVWAKPHSLQETPVQPQLASNENLTPLDNAEHAEDNIDTHLFNILKVEHLSDDSNEAEAFVDQSICHVCNIKIRTNYVCMKCKRNVHLDCIANLIIDGIKASYCMSCTKQSDTTEPLEEFDDFEEKIETSVLLDTLPNTEITEHNLGGSMEEES